MESGFLTVVLGFAAQIDAGVAATLFHESTDRLRAEAGESWQSSWMLRGVELAPALTWIDVYRDRAGVDAWHAEVGRQVARLHRDPCLPMKGVYAIDRDEGTVSEEGRVLMVFGTSAHPDTLGRLADQWCTPGGAYSCQRFIVGHAVDTELPGQWLALTWMHESVELHRVMGSAVKTIEEKGVEPPEIVAQRVLMLRVVSGITA